MACYSKEQAEMQASKTRAFGELPELLQCALINKKLSLCWSFMIIFCFKAASIRCTINHIS